MKRIIYIVASILLGLSVCSPSSAENNETAGSLTEFLESYNGTEGVDFMPLKGLKLNFAKPALKKTPMKNVADKIDNMCVFTIENPGIELRKQFISSLAPYLESYEKAKTTREGKKESTIYLKRKDDAVISEMIVYSDNGNISIVLMRGDIPLASIEQTRQKAE